MRQATGTKPLQVHVAGTTPSVRARRKSLELLRNAMVGVTIVTFDELLARLEEIHAALSPSAEVPANGEVPF